MVLNKKSLSILNLFFSLNKFSYSDLEKILDIKKRSIDNNINIINEFLAAYEIQGIQKEENLFFLEPCAISKIKNILQFAPLSVTERKEYLLLKLFFENIINLNSNTDKLQTTRRTLNYDLEDIKEYLERKGLKIESVSGKGIFLEGDESKIRELFSIHLTKYLINKNTNHKLFADLIESYFNEEVLDFNKNFILKLLNTISVTLVPEDFYRVAAILLVNSVRKNKDILKNKSYVPKAIIHHKYYDKSLKFLKDKGLNHLESYELESIIEILFYLDIKQYKTLNNNTKIFINKVKEVFDTDLSTNLQTVMRISNVLRIAELKQEYNFYENKGIYHLNKTQQEEYKRLDKIVKEIFDKVYFEDVLQLSVVLKEHMANSNLDREKYKRVVIVDNTFDHIYGKILSRYLKNFSFVEVIKIMESHGIMNCTLSSRQFK